MSRATRNPKREMRELLANSWTQDLSDGSGLGYEQPAGNSRNNSVVPRPDFIVGAREGERSVHMNQTDIVFCLDGGSTQEEPAGVGYVEERVEAPVDVAVVTSESEQRLFGDDEQYSGLKGEVKRILYANRLGTDSFDRIQIDGFTDESEEYGADIWRGRWATRFIQFAQRV